jgi:hypothetical protein
MRSGRAHTGSKNVGGEWMDKSKMSKTGKCLKELRNLGGTHEEHKKGDKICGNI